MSAYGFINRGFSTVVAPALGGSLLDTDCVIVRPLHRHLPDRRDRRRSCRSPSPGPWKTESHADASATTAASAAGSTTTRSATRSSRSSRDEANAVTFGNHCRKGRFGFDYVHAPDRLLTRRGSAPGRELQDAPVDEAIALRRRCA